MITPDDVRRLAELARIEVPSTEQESLRADLDRILAYVSELSGVSTERVQAAPERSGNPNAARDDAARETALPGDTARAAFPSSREGWCEVPGVFSE